MNPHDDKRNCPRCERELSGREHYGQGGLTMIWQCVCGWASARTVSSDEARALGSSKASGVRARPRFEEIVPADETKPREGEG